MGLHLRSAKQSGRYAIGPLNLRFFAKGVLTNLLWALLSVALGSLAILAIGIYSPAGGVLGTQMGSGLPAGLAGLLSAATGSAVGLLFIGAFLLLTPRGGLRFFWIALCGMLPLLGFFVYVFSALGSNPFRLSIAIDIVFLCLAMAWMYKTRRPAYAH